MASLKAQQQFEAAIAQLSLNIAAAIRLCLDNPAKTDLIIANIPHWPGMALLRKVQPLDADSTRRVVLHRNGDRIHFDVTVDFQRIAKMIGYKAEKSRSHVSKLQDGAVSVEHIT